MLLGRKVQYFLLVSLLCFNMKTISFLTEFTRNQSLLEFTLNCIEGFLSSEVECVMKAYEEDKGIAIFNNDSLTCQTCRVDDDGSYVSHIGDVAWSEWLS